jgi:HPt (histidine-containing phosphotransfer) domain-containing protein
MALAHANVAVQSTAERAPEQAYLAPIDRAHLARYTLGNLALEIEVLELFSGQAPLTLAALASATTDKAWRDAAHTLKGSARAVGAQQVAALAESAERIAGRPDGLARLRVIAALSEALDEAAMYIESLKSHG